MLQRAWVEQQFHEVTQQLKLFAASGIAKTLSPMLMQNLSTVNSQLHGMANCYINPIPSVFFIQLYM